jgi:hypothetical protein
MMSVKGAAESLKTSMGPMSEQMAAMTKQMAKPRKVQRDETGRIVGVQPEG